MCIGTEPVEKFVGVAQPAAAETASKPAETQRNAPVILTDPFTTVEEKVRYERKYQTYLTPDLAKAEREIIAVLLGFGQGQGLSAQSRLTRVAAMAQVAIKNVIEQGK